MSNPTPNLAPENTITVCGHPINASPFTERHLDAWARIEDEYDLDTINQKRVALNQRIQHLQTTEVEAQQRAVDALKSKLDAEYAKDYEKWDREKIQKLKAALNAEVEALVETEDLASSDFAIRTMRLTEELVIVQSHMNEARLKMAHELAKEQGCEVEFGAWQRTATAADYTAANEVVKAGLTPFLERAHLQARKRGLGA